MNERPDNLPDLLLEQLALGEISPEDERRLRAAYAPHELEERLAALRAANAAFHAEVDPERAVQGIRDRLRAERARRSQRGLGGLSRPMLATATFSGLAVAACVVLFALGPGPAPQDGAPGYVLEGPDTTRVKGAAHLVLYRQRGELAELLDDQARAREGDVLQVGYVASEARHGAIVSIDGRGAATLHFPDDEAGSTLLDRRGEQLLGHAYELDAAPAFERFFFVTATRPVDVKKVMAAARALAEAPNARRAPLALPTSLSQQSLTLVKE